jgi:hypothetical protein
MIGRSRCSSCCMRVLRVAKNLPRRPTRDRSLRCEADLPVPLLAPLRAVVVEDVHVSGVLAGNCLEACLFSRSFLSDPFFSPSHVPKDLADKDGLGDRLPESVLVWAGWHIGKATYCATYLARDRERETAPALPRQCESREALSLSRKSRAKYVALPMRRQARDARL